MGLFSILIAITVLSSPISCNDNSVLNPAVFLRSLSTMLSVIDTMINTEQSAYDNDTDDDVDSSESYDNDDVVINKKQEPQNSIVINININSVPDKSMWNLFRKGFEFNFMKPQVEMAPGTFKTDKIKYPADHYKNRLKYLLKLQEKRDHAS